MGGRRYLGMSVFDAAIERLKNSYEAGHRVLVSTSGGKDSTVCTELAVIAARETGRLPVEVVHRDEEIIHPGTTEYLERVAERTDEVKFWWICARNPVINSFDRWHPYFWVFDDRLDPDEWVRKPPSWATWIDDIDIQKLTTAERFPPDPGKEVHGVLGLRADESRGRMLGTHSAGGYFTGVDKTGVCGSRPLYDWTEGDVWKAIFEMGWDYNRAYDVMHRLGLSRRELRIAPPTMNPAGADHIRDVCRVAWPGWWNRVVHRLPSVRTVALYGKRAIEATRLYGESWQDCYLRSCIEEAPDWIATRARIQMEITVGGHSKHSTAPFPQTRRGHCLECGVLGSWETLVSTMYLGDPFSVKASKLPYVDPVQFRPDLKGKPQGYWSGRPGILQGANWSLPVEKWEAGLASAGDPAWRGVYGW
jgi:predicted phosphoadenosine phosphosulfate sulfurtransferase